ncbi:MAG: SMP-30/gluconolactonase/LRE family protein [Bryobacterales bacterium]|nr:SMP-30/gluconolactonase/LRE family protein [Bryobacterales bacterium]
MRLPTCCLLLIAAAPAAFAQSASRYVITTLAGNGSAGYSGDGGPGAVAQLSNPYDIALDRSGGLYIADQFNHRIRHLSGGAISTAAGSGSSGYSGDGGSAAGAALNHPSGVVVDSSGNIYISDSGNQVVRKFTQSGAITTVAGNNSQGAGYTGDGTAATNGQLRNPIGVAVDSAGNLYIADKGNHVIRKVASGNITTVVGKGVAGFSGDGGDAGSASLSSPSDVAFDAAGNLYIADTENHRLREVTTDGNIKTIAGTGIAGFSGDFGPAIHADLNYPTGVAVDAAGNVYIADSVNSRIRKVTTTGIISTIAGNGLFQYSGDGGPATNASLNFPLSVAVDASDNVYVSDTQNNAVRMLTPVADSALPPVITSITGKQDYGALPSVSPGSWIEIHGANLAATARSWSAADFDNLKAPTSLDGVSVTVAGQPAAVNSISAGAIVALVPSSVDAGDQPVTVTTITGASAPFTLRIDPTQPALYAPPSFNLDGKQYVSASLLDGSGYALPDNAVGGVRSRPAHPGDTVVLFGAGFGAVTPHVPFGEIVKQSNALTGSVQIAFGETEAVVSFAGLARNNVGLYQFNVVIPAGIPSGAVPLTVTFNGGKLTQTLYVSAED